LNKLPWGKFYWADWRKDPGLRSCSLAARGLWIDMLSLAYESEEIGYLVVNGAAMTNRDIARGIGADPRLSNRLTRELEVKGVFSRDPRGAIYSRRMVRDAQISNERAKAGRLGGGNPLLKQTHDHLFKQNDSGSLNKNENLFIPRSQKSELENTKGTSPLGFIEPPTSRASNGNGEGQTPGISIPNGKTEKLEPEKPRHMTQAEQVAFALGVPTPAPPSIGDRGDRTTGLVPLASLLPRSIGPEFDRARRRAAKAQARRIRANNRNRKGACQ
jgi:hypothetical protein